METAGARLRNQRGPAPQTATQGRGQQRKSVEGGPPSPCGLRRLSTHFIVPCGGNRLRRPQSKEGDSDWRENYRENLLGHLFACLLLDRYPILCGHGGNAFFHTPCHRELIKRGDRVHAHHQSLGRGVSADAFGELCAGYLTNYQTPCVQGHVCECVQYTTANRSWLDCRDYGRVKSKAY
jgi:hypothetical protein